MKPIRHIKGLLNTALTASILISCLDKYPVSRDLAPENPPLVVEGFIDAGKQTATVVLTRAIPVMDETAPPREANANVRISVSNSETLKLPETEPGLYTLTNLHLDFEKKYSLLITTADGTGFTSDPITLQRTPAIDSITWGASAADDALDIMVNSHDTYGNGKFFIWNFEETWQYHSAFNSELKWVKGQAVPRDPGESVSSCFSTYKSKNILLATNQHLREQVISRVVINQIPKGAQKTQERYSILVNQRVLSPEEFKYQSELKRTTESLGGLFDPITGYVPGNMHQDGDPGAFVIGYFSGGEITQKRIFIQFVDLPTSLKVSTKPFTCTALRTCSLFLPPNSNNGGLPCEFFANLNNVGLISVQYNQQLNLPEFYVYADERCTDCRLQGGVLERPSFWPVEWN